MRPFVPRPRHAAVLAALLSVVGAARCGDPPSQTPDPPAVVLPAPTEFTQAPSLTRTATTPVVPLPDVAPSDLRSTYAPSVCGAPEHRIRGYRGYGLDGIETHLQVTTGYDRGMPPVPPLLVDVDGDGSRDALVVLTCRVDGVAQPDHLVLYTAGPRPIGAVGLDPLQRQRHGAVRALRVEDGRIVVEWAAFEEPGAATTPYEAVVRYGQGRLSLEQAGRSGGPREVEVEAGAFVTPDGNVRCVVRSGVAWCSAASTTWRPSAPPAGSDCEPASYGRTLSLYGGTARRSCATQDDTQAAVLGRPMTTWHRSGWDPVVRASGARSAGLAAGSSMRSGRIVCRVRTARTVRCEDERTTSFFTIGRDDHGLSRQAGATPRS